MKRLQDQVIILRKIKHGESDLILHAISSSGARLNFMAKGALSIKKRFGGGILEPTHFLKVEYQVRSEGSGDALHWLEEASLLKEFTEIKTDYDRLELAFDFLQILSRVSQEGLEDGKEVFHLLAHALTAAGRVKDLGRLRCLFELKLLWLQGVLPEDLQGHPWLRYSMANVDEINSSHEQDKTLGLRVRYQMDDFLENRF